MSVVEADGDTDNGDQELADQHAESTPEENRTTAESLDCPERQGRGANVDQGENERDKKSVVNGSSRLQERGGIIEDEVNTSPTVLVSSKLPDDFVKK